MASGVKKEPYPSNALLAIRTRVGRPLRLAPKAAWHAQSPEGGLFPQVGPSRGNGLADGFVPQGRAVGVSGLIGEAAVR